MHRHFLLKNDFFFLYFLPLFIFFTIIFWSKCVLVYICVTFNGLSVVYMECSLLLRFHLYIIGLNGSLSNVWNKHFCLQFNLFPYCCCVCCVYINFHFTAFLSFIWFYIQFPLNMNYTIILLLFFARHCMCRCSFQSYGSLCICWCLCPKAFFFYSMRNDIFSNTKNERNTELWRKCENEKMKRIFEINIAYVCIFH